MVLGLNSLKKTAKFTPLNPESHLTGADLTGVYPPQEGLTTFPAVNK